MGWMQITDPKPTRAEAESDMVRTVNTGLEKRVYEVIKWAEINARECTWENITLDILDLKYQQKASLKYRIRFFSE